MRALALLLLLLLPAACGEEEKNPSDINDSDLDNLNIETYDATSVLVYTRDDIVGENRLITVQNVSQGPLSETTSGRDGTFEVVVPGTLDHVYAITSEGADPLPVTRTQDGAVVRGYSVSFAGATGCELQEWSGIIREAAGDSLTTCALQAGSTPQGEVASGPVEPFVMRRDTRVTLWAAIVGVDGEPPRFEIDFVDQVPEAFTVPVIAQNPDGQFGPTLLQVGQISPELPGRIVESLEIRSPTGSGLIIADIKFESLDPVIE
jgi:hypothetical protein